MGQETHPSRRSNIADLHKEKLRSLVNPHGAFMPTEIVRSETVLYLSLCTDNVTFITDQIGSFNCNVCVLTARSRQGAVSSAWRWCQWQARYMWITRKPYFEPSPGYTGTIWNIANVVMYVCVLELCCWTALYTRQNQNKVPHLNWCIHVAFLGAGKQTPTSTMSMIKQSKKWLPNTRLSYILLKFWIMSLWQKPKGKLLKYQMYAVIFALGLGHVLTQ